MADKNRSVWLSGTAAVLVMAGFAVPVASPASPPAAFSPPSAQLVLTRTLNRSLPDGNAIVTTRSYAVHIIRDGAGYRVEGTLINVKTEAPPMLAALADIERKRADDGLFPIMLDEQGFIAGGGKVLVDGSLDKSAVVAARALGSAGLPVQDRAQAQAFVSQLQGRPARSEWPADIFRPLPGRRSESRTVQLPDGNQGNVMIEIMGEIMGQGLGQNGLIAALERVVTTDLAGDRRVTREQWQLSRSTATEGR